MAFDALQLLSLATHSAQKIAGSLCIGVQKGKGGNSTGSAGAGGSVPCVEGDDWAYPFYDPVGPCLLRSHRAPAFAARSA